MAAFATIARDPELNRIIKVRARLARTAPAVASILFRLDIGPHTETTLTKTAATDGKRMYWNREYIRSITNDELEGLLMHEGLHVFLRHPYRRGNIEPTMFNYATDYGINLMIKDQGLTLPKGALLDEKYRAMTAEQIIRSWNGKPPAATDYGIPPPPPPTKPTGEGEGEGEGKGKGQDEDQAEKEEHSGKPNQDFPGVGEVWDAVDEEGDRLKGEELEEEEEQLRREILTAGLVERIAGTGTFTVDKGVYDDAKGAGIDWREAIRDFIERSCPQESTLDIPSRRHLWNGYFPGTTGVTGGNFVIAIDTSGSTSRDRETYAAEIESLRETVQPDRTIIIYCDDHIQKTADGESYDVFENFEDITVRKINGGGTSFNPPFHLVKREGLEPSVFIYFTDGYGWVQPKVCEEVDYPVLWAASNGHEPHFGGQPFGEIIPVDLSHL